MLALLGQYLDADFISEVSAYFPAFGVGLLVGFIVAILGWAVGFVVRLSKLDI